MTSNVMILACLERPILRSRNPRVPKMFDADAVADQEDQVKRDELSSLALVLARHE